MSCLISLNYTEDESVWRDIGYEKATVELVSIIVGAKHPLVPGRLLASPRGLFWLACCVQSQRSKEVAKYPKCKAAASSPGVKESTRLLQSPPGGRDHTRTNATLRPTENAVPLRVVGSASNFEPTASSRKSMSS